MIYVDTLPQNIEPIRIITLKEVLGMLPETLAYDLNVWLGGKIARYGQTSDTLTFLVESEDEPPTELKLYFESLTDPIPSTVNNSWRDEKISAMRFYNEGRLIVDKETLKYTELPSTTELPPIITLDEVLSKLPEEISWMEDTYLTGSIAKYGWSGNDIDFMIDTEDTNIFTKARQLFVTALQCKVDVGNADMSEREPVYKFKIYGGGKCLL